MEITVGQGRLQLRAQCDKQRCRTAQERWGERLMVLCRVDVSEPAKKSFSEI